MNARCAIDVILMHDILGGNLAAALSVKCILKGVKTPVGNVLVYPALNMHMSPSPSRFLHQSDPILPRGILELALNSYYSSHGDSTQYKQNIHDPCVSPGLADDHILRQFPPTHLIVGDMDPLLDDSVDFHTRLTQLSVVSSLQVCQGDIPFRIVFVYFFIFLYIYIYIYWRHRWGGAI